MILNKLLKLQKLKSVIKNTITKNIFDIVIYGSIVRGKEKYTDIDIAIIYKNKIAVEEKLLASQQLKNKLSFLDCDVDVKTINMYDLLDASFLARQGIIAEGYSLTRNKFLHELFGFKAYYEYKYNISIRSESKKKMFYYALKGRRSEKGIAQKTDSVSISNCVLRTPIQSSSEIEEVFLLHKIPFKKELCLIPTF